MTVEEKALTNIIKNYESVEILNMEFIIKDNKNDKIISSAKTIDELSDGYHTFKELYDFRREYNAALVNTGVWKAHRVTGIMMANCALVAVGLL